MGTWTSRSLSTRNPRSPSWQRSLTAWRSVLGYYPPPFSPGPMGRVSTIPVLKGCSGNPGQAPLRGARQPPGHPQGPQARPTPVSSLPLGPPGILHGEVRRGRGADCQGFQPRGQKQAGPAQGEGDAKTHTQNLPAGTTPHTHLAPYTWPPPNTCFNAGSCKRSWIRFLRTANSQS